MVSVAQPRVSGGPPQNGAVGTQKTIAAGVIEIEGPWHRVDTESAAASDDLDTINGGEEGDELILLAASSARTIVVKHLTGNIVCGSDRSLTSGNDVMKLLNVGGNLWLMLSFADNAA